MKAILSLFMSIITFLLSTFGISVIKPEGQPGSSNGFVPVVRAMICSDAHVTAAGDDKCEKLQKAFSYVYSVAEEDANYTNVDAAIFVGDSINDGEYEQLEAFYDTVYSAKKENTKLLAAIARNHDCYAEMGKSTRDYYVKKTGNDIDSNYVINGIHFIGISTSAVKNQMYSTAQRKWLRTQLDAAVAEDPTKPIIVYNHEHVFETVYGSSAFDGWGITNFRDILDDYPQVVHFSGHSHYPANDPRSIWQGSFTAVGTGALAYMEFTVGAERKIRPESGDECAQGWIVEIDTSNRVRLRAFDAITNSILCEYVLDDVTDAKNFAYTPAQQKASSSAPAFDEDSSLVVEKNGDKYDVTVPKANSTDGKIIFLYRIKVTNKYGVKTHSEYILNNYWIGKPYDSVTFTVDAKPGYTVSVTAENAYGMASNALTAKIS